MNDGPVRDIRRELRQAPWEEIFPELLAYARRRLANCGLLDRSGYVPSAVEVRELINDAVEQVLDAERSKRTWNEANPPGLVPLLCGIMSSRASVFYKKWKLRRVRHVPEQEAELVPGDAGEHPVDDQVVTGAEDPRLVHLHGAVGDDPKLLDLVEAIKLGAVERAELADLLGWQPAEVSVQRKKLQRRLLRMGTPVAKERA